MITIRLSAHILGAGQPESIVFLPGFTGSHATWNADFLALRQRYQLVLLDTLGFGHSPKPDVDYTIADHVDAIHATLQELQIQRAHVVGHSMGCLLALAYATRFPAMVTKLALLALPCYRDEHEARAMIGRSSLMNRLAALDTPLAHLACTVMCAFRPLFLAIAPQLAPDVPPAVARDALRHTWRSYAGTLRNVIFQAPTSAWLAETRQPLLIIQGRQDRIAPPDNVIQAVAEHPHVQIIVLEAGHRLIFSHSAEISATIARFFSEPDASKTDEPWMTAHAADAGHTTHAS
jgi:pimeloyl-ACP methyl ester carboxylesterase